MSLYDGLFNTILGGIRIAESHLLNDEREETYRQEWIERLSDGRLPHKFKFHHELRTKGSEYRTREILRRGYYIPGQNLVVVSPKDASLIKGMTT